MLFSLNRLKKLANLADRNLNEIILALNSIGFEVESSYQFVQPNTVVLAKIIKKTKHPKADRLFILELDTGDKIHQVITSATVYEQTNVAFFLPGSMINGVKLEPISFFGIESHGMLCSLEELQIPTLHIHDDLKGEILTLPDTYQLGINIIEALELDDYILDIDILTNRSDAKSYYVLSRELAAFFETKWSYNIAVEKQSYQSDIVVTNGLANHLSMFVAKVTKIKRSKLETEILLMKSGIKPINEIVDLTSLTLIEMNQPTHAYDLDKLKGSITVKKADGEAIFMDNKKYTFKDTLVICDDENIISIAGISGIPQYSITDNTRRVLFEVGNFSNTKIRKTLKKTKFFSESSNRFGKKMNPNLINPTILLMKSKLETYTQTLNPHINTHTKIKLNENLIKKYTHNKIIELSVYKKALSKLEKLGFVFGEKNNVLCPEYRHDLKIDVDMIEEILRFISYSNIKPECPVLMGTLVPPKKISFKNMLVAQGFSEVITNSLRNENYNLFNPFEFSDQIKLSTYISLNRIVYRNSLAPSLLEIAMYNQNRKIDQISLFEIGKVHGEKNDHIAIATNQSSYLELTKTILNLFSQFGEITFKRSKYKLLHPGVSADIFINNNYLGFIGKTHPNFMDNDFFIFEICLGAIFKYGSLNQKFHQYFSGSYITKDFTFKLGRNESLDTILNKLNNLESIDKKSIIDEYIINDDTKSITLKIYFNKSLNTKKDIDLIKKLTN